ncbi:hypothetical protein N9Y42_06960 [Mariniblastus sp.]|nr:hypothetical protein [Mariniblastus sp.]
MCRPILACCIGLFFWVSSVAGQDIDPRGIYFNRFNGQFSGTEFFQVTPVDGSTTQFDIRDIYGGGFRGTIDAAGTIVIPGESMDGMFSDPDNFEIFPFDGGFTFSSNRIPTTTVDFPLTLESPRPANPLLNGQWNNTLRSINPETGAMGTPGTEIITITTTGNLVRITDPNGLFFQGVFEDGLTAGYRVVANPSFAAARGIFATFPGSSTNTGQDLLGEMNMISINEFRASFMLQTRTPLGNQNQVLFEFEATRVTPFAEGDANGDGAVDSADETIVSDLQGATFEDDNYDLAADINSDGVINDVDLNFYLLPGDVNLDNVVDFSDISPFIVLLANGGFQIEADLDQSGEVDFSDIAPFIVILSGP